MKGPPAVHDRDVRSRVYLSLGSNLDPQRHLRAGLADLRARLGAITVSPVYRSKAFGFVGPDFLNLVVCADTDMDPMMLHTWLHEVEARHGRRRDVPRFSNHTLDIDLVLFADLVLDMPGLVLPRPDITRAYVLKPLADIAPLLVVPGFDKTLSAMWDEQVTAMPPLLERIEDIA